MAEIIQSNVAQIVVLSIAIISGVGKIIQEITKAIIDYKKMKSEIGIDQYKPDYSLLQNNMIFDKINKMLIKLEGSSYDIIQCKYKRFFTKKLLKIKLTAYKEILQREIVDKVKNEKDAETAIDSIAEMVYDAIDNYKEEAIKRGIPEIYLNVYNEFHRDSEIYAYETLLEIKSSKYYTTNFDRLDEMLSYISFILIRVSLDIGKAINVKNGGWSDALKDYCEKNNLKVV